MLKIAEVPIKNTLNYKPAYFLSGIIASGFTVCLIALYNLPVTELNLRFFILSGITILFASRLSIQIPNSKVHFLMGDSLIFLTLLLYGGEAAVLLAGVEAFCTSYRLKRKGVFHKFSTILQNTGIMACSTAATYAAVLLYNSTVGHKKIPTNWADFLALLGLIAIVHFAANNFITALGGALKSGSSFRKTFVEKCLGSFPIYIASAVFAGLIYTLIQNSSEFVIVIATIIISLLYVAYNHYFNEIRLKQKQAEQAKIEQAESERLRLKEAARHFVALRESQQMLQLVMDNIPQHIVWKDLDLNFLGCNRVMLDKLRLADVTEIIGKNEYDFFSRKEEAGLYRSYDRQVLETGIAQFHTVESLTLFNGNTIWLEMSRIPLRNIEDKTVGLLCSFQDITDIKSANEERRNLEEQLRQSQKLESVGQLAAGIAHEINTPLQYVGDNMLFLKDAFENLSTAIEKYEKLLAACRTENIDRSLIGETQKALKECDVDFLIEEVPTALEQSLEGVQRVTHIVQSMKTFAHPGTSEMKAVNLNECIDSTITVSSNEWKYVAEMQTDFDELLPPVICIGSEINQVVLNMIINAAHAISDVVGKDPSEKGKITVKTRRNADWAEIYIGDSGKGIPEEIRGKIFDPFFTTKEVGKGTGQGLAISHRVISKHNGNLNFETQIDKGTTFIIRLPINGSAIESSI